MDRAQFLSLAAAAAVAPFLGSLPAAAQDSYPSKPIKIVMPVPPGSGLDVIARVICEQMATRLGQPIVIESKPGAGGAIAANAVVGASPDGYTLLGGAASVFTILPAQKDKLAFDVNRDLVQIGLIGSGAMVLAVGSQSEIRSFADFLALARARPSTVNIGMTGAGTLPHFAGLSLAKASAIPMTVVPYNTGGTTDAIKDILGGRLTAVIEGLNGLKGAIDGGQLRAIATLAPARDPALPGVPAAAETLPGFHAGGFMTLAAPAGTPDPIVQKLNAALRLALELPQTKARFVELGFAAAPLSPTETRAFVDAEQKLWWPLVRELGVN